ncbi:hypothetical protein HBB16_19705 [Pseudonocardia sp. MCCB 268]|nr:hypothetical protein [Pseudonocardia cytotoxica]
MRDGHRIVHQVEGFHGCGFPPSEADFVAKYRSLAGRSFEPAVDRAGRPAARDRHRGRRRVGRPIADARSPSGIGGS